MNAKIQCPHCSAWFVVPHTVLGKRTKCTKCGERFVLEAAEEPAPATPANFSSEEAVSPVSGDSPASPTFPDVSPAPPLLPSRIETQFEPRSTVDDPADRAIRSRSRSKQFWALRAVARIYEVSAWVVAGVTLTLLVVYALWWFAQALQGEAGAGAVAWWTLQNAFTLLWAALLVTGLLFVAQMIRLALQIEQNTFETREACQRVAQTQHVHPEQ